ncbi:MAG: acetolactate decarboxylase [Neisseriaceae bacterium]
MLFQISTFSALKMGDYEGDFPYSELIKRGNFGLGLLNKLDAGMVALNGKFYAFTVDGKVGDVPVDARLPYGMVIHFQANELNT